jgi:hypothetical protein
MAGRRLVPPELVDEWELQLRRAVNLAMADMQREVNRTLHVSRGTALVAAGPRPAGVAASVWSVDYWTNLVHKHIAVVAGAVGVGAVAAARKSMPKGATYGFPASSTEAQIKQMLVDRSLASGAYMGERLNGDLLAAPSPAAQVKALVNFWNTAATIQGDVVGSSANGAAGMAEYTALGFAGATQGAFPGATRNWADFGDDKVRDGHHATDVDPVGLNESFVVNGESLMFPQDPEGSDGNTINCRCHVETDGVDVPDE